MFMRTTPTGTNEPLGLITVVWVINYWLIYANKLVLSPLMSTSVGALKPNVVTAKLKS